MTREEILAFPAGPELDALVRHHVFGGCLTHRFEDLRPDRWAARCRGCGQEEGMGPGQNAVLLMNDPAPYSTEIASAWEVVEKLKGSKWPEWLYIELSYEPHDTWCAVFSWEDGARVEVGKQSSAPLAICRAAILATLEPE